MAWGQGCYINKHKDPCHIIVIFNVIRVLLKLKPTQGKQPRCNYVLRKTKLVSIRIKVTLDQGFQYTLMVHWCFLICV